MGAKGERAQGCETWAQDMGAKGTKHGHSGERAGGLTPFHLLTLAPKEPPHKMFTTNISTKCLLDVYVLSKESRKVEENTLLTYCQLGMGLYRQGIV